MKRFDIGIDPPKGFALFDNDKNKLVELKTLTFWKVVDELTRLNDLGLINRVVIEAPQKNKPVWRRSGQSEQQMMKISQNVGSNKRDSQLLIELCERNEIPHLAVRPNKKSMTKLTKEQFKRITGCDGQSSEHSRDAAMLVFRS